MPSLLDIAPIEIATEMVTVGEPKVALEVRGLSLRDIAVLLKRFPDLRRQWAGQELSDDDIMILGIETAPAIISAGLVKQYPEEEVAKRLRPEDQAALVEAIMRLTNPPGRPAGPLSETPRDDSAIPAASSSAEAPAAAPVTNSL